MKMGLKTWLTNPSTKIIMAGLFLQMTIIGIYVNRKLTDTVEVFAPAKRVQEFYRSVLSMRSTETAESDFSKKHRERVNRIREYCASYKLELTKTYPRYERLEDVLPSWNWITSPFHHLFYCATPKCASTTWKTYIMEDLKMEWSIDTHKAATQLGVATMFPKKMPTFKDFLEMYRPTNRLMIVRNPWARLVSAYEDKIAHTHWELEKLCVAHKKYDRWTNNVTFARFIDCLASSPRNVIWNPHVNPLTSLCGVCQMDYNMIVKLEEMNEAEPFIFHTLNFTSKPKYTPLRKGKYNNTYVSHYEGISEEIIERLHDIYKSDIELFNYPSTPFV